MLFQSLESEISMLLGSVPIKITSNSENASRFGLYESFIQCFPMSCV